MTQASVTSQCSILAGEGLGDKGYASDWLLHKHTVCILGEQEQNQLSRLGSNQAGCRPVGEKSGGTQHPQGLEGGKALSTKKEL